MDGDSDDVSSIGGDSGEAGTTISGSVGSASVIVVSGARLMLAWGSAWGNNQYNNQATGLCCSPCSCMCRRHRVIKS